MLVDRMGLFIVLEGIDGSGTETQSKLLKEFLDKKGKKTELIKYPDYDGPIGKLIHDFLHNKFDLPPDVQFSLYATDMLKDKDRILNGLKEGRIIIADRYFTSTIAYQSMTKGFSLEKGIKFAELFDLPKPDLVIFLDISPKTSTERKLKEKKVLDRHEADEAFLEKVRESYLELIERKIFAKRWFIIDGERSIEDVAGKVQEIVMKELEKVKT